MNDLDKESLKFLRALAAPNSSKSIDHLKRLERNPAKRIKLCHVLGKRSLVQSSQAGEWTITDEGRFFLKRVQCDSDTAFQRQHQEIVLQEIEPGEKVTLNLAESSLARLYHRRGKSGERLISRIQLDAGERLRKDFEAAGAAPKLGLTLAPKVDGGGHHGALTSVLTGSLAAKDRVERAIGAVGPELASLLLDVCCYLKGLETVERERRWPVRSGKVVLSVALNQLANHYGYEEQARGRSYAKVS